MKKVVIIGAGGMGREVLDVIDACNKVNRVYEPLGFIVDIQFGAPGTMINERPILGGFDWLEHHVDDIYVICGVGGSHLRYQLIQRAESLNCRFINLIHPSVILSRQISIGEGNVITAGCILTNHIQIGNHVIVNLSCTIGHDASLQNFVTMGQGVHVSGNVTLGTGCYIGTGTNIVEKIHVGEWSIIGAGSAIIRNIPANTTVVGVPGRVIKEREARWYLK